MKTNKDSAFNRLIAAVAATIGTRRKPYPAKHSRAVVDAVGEVIAAELAGAAGRFAWPGFGVFRRTTRKARRIRNPATHELMQLPGTTSVRFRAAKDFKARLNTRRAR